MLVKHLNLLSKIKYYCQNLKSKTWYRLSTKSQSNLPKEIMKYKFQCPVIDDITYYSSESEYEEEKREERRKQGKNETFVTEKKRRFYIPINSYKNKGPIRIKELYTHSEYKTQIVPNLRRVYLTITSKDLKIKVKDNNNSDRTHILHPDVVNSCFSKYNLKPISYLAEMLREKQTLIAILYLIRMVGIDNTLNVIEYF